MRHDKLNSGQFGYFFCQDSIEDKQLCTTAVESVLSYLERNLDTAHYIGSLQQKVTISEHRLAAISILRSLVTRWLAQIE